MSVKTVAFCKEDGEIYNTAVFDASAEEADYKIHLLEETDFAVEIGEDLAGIGDLYNPQTRAFVEPEPFVYDYEAEGLPHPNNYDPDNYDPNNP